MPFAKAGLDQPKLRLALYGPPGSGKSFSALLIAEGLAKTEKKRIAYVDTEADGGGTSFYSIAVPDRTAHPEAFDFDKLATQSLAEADREVRHLDPDVYGVLVIDSITHLWDAAIAAVEKTKIGTVKMSEWGKVKRPFKGLVKWMMESPFHVIICGRQKNVFKDDEHGDPKQVGVTMQAEKDTLYEPQIAIRLDPKVNQKDTTRTTYYAYVEKDRTGLLAGRTMANLKWDHFVPVYNLLGGKQAMTEDPDKTALKDAELLEQQQLEVEEKKAEKSAKILEDYSAKINAAKTLVDMNKIANELKKKRGSLLGDDHTALTQQWTRKAQRFQKEQPVGKDG